MASNLGADKDSILQTVQRELENTLKVLKAFPSDKTSFKPSEQLRSAGEVAKGLVPGQGGPVDQVMQGVLGTVKGVVDSAKGVVGAATGAIGGAAGMGGGKGQQGQQGGQQGQQGGQQGQMPTNFNEIASTFERTSRDLMDKLPKLQDLEGKVQPLLMGLLNLAQIRGQLAVYLSLAGGKMPEGMGTR